jgi:TnpA family transposase
MLSSYPSLNFTAHFNPAYVRQHWDDLLRVAGSLKTGWVSASLLLSKLQAYPRQHHLTHLLQEYGRLVKTAFTCATCTRRPCAGASTPNSQLNKGEQLHALRSWLWFRGDGVLRHKQEEAQQQVVRCLNVVTNIVVVWNTVYAQLALQRQQAVGPPVLPEHLAQLSPARFAHLNRLGRYAFHLPADVLVNGLRPLRPLP